MTATETPAALLRRAAELVEQHARQATPGTWEIEYAYRPPGKAQGLFVGCNPEEACASRGDCYDGTHGIGGFDRDPDVRWAALVNPAIAEALVACLRAEADLAEVIDRRPDPASVALGIDDTGLPGYADRPPALALAQALLGEKP